MLNSSNTNRHIMTLEHNLAPTPGYEECCPHGHPVCCGVNKCCVRTPAPFAMTERLINNAGQSLAAAVQEADVGKDMTIIV